MTDNEAILVNSTREFFRERNIPCTEEQWHRIFPFTEATYAEVPPYFSGPYKTQIDE